MGQMKQVLGGDTLSSEAKLVLFAGKGEIDAIDAPQVFGVGEQHLRQ
jgi:predicted ThiF/HesA family dinucleotide-utilizing enzyme